MNSVSLLIRIVRRVFVDEAPLMAVLVTYLKLSLKALNTTCIAGAAAVDLDMPQGLVLHTNDLQGQLCGRLLSLRLPLVAVKGLVTSDTSRKSWSEAVALDFDIALDSFTSPKTSDNPQSAFLHEQDVLTQRGQYLLGQLTEARINFGRKPHAADRNGQRRPSHRVHRNDLYLPPLVLPQFRRVQKANVQQQQQQQPSPALRWSRLSHMSESDGENVSEVERDARLARSRIFAPTAADYVDGSEPSDDESDDTDLTDSGSWESEWSANPGE